jgi:hypothetical protein
VAISDECDGGGKRRADDSSSARMPQTALDVFTAYRLVFLTDCFWVGWHYPRRFHPGLNLVLQLSQFHLGEVLHLSMQEFLRVASLGEVKGTPFIGILKDEPLVSLDGFILRLSLYHASLFS